MGGSSMVFRLLKAYQTNTLYCRINGYLKDLKIRLFYPRTCINKQGYVVKCKRPSKYGYVAPKEREGAWCRRCATNYWIDKAVRRVQGTPDRWLFITKEMTNINCSICGRKIR